MDRVTEDQAAVVEDSELLATITIMTIEQEPVVKAADPKLRTTRRRNHKTSERIARDIANYIVDADLPLHDPEGLTLASPTCAHGRSLGMPGGGAGPNCPNGGAMTP